MLTISNGMWTAPDGSVMRDAREALAKEQRAAACLNYMGPVPRQERVAFLRFAFERGSGGMRRPLRMPHFQGDPAVERGSVS